MRIKLSIAAILTGQIVFSQTPQDQFNKAKEWYDKGNNKQCITTLQAIEKQIGANPKLYSLYTNAYLAEKDFVNAAISLHQFKKLIANKRTDAIQNILDLEKEINTGVEAAEKKHQEAVFKKRVEEADRVILARKEKSQQKEQFLTSTFAKTKETQLAGLSTETINEDLRSLPEKEKYALLKSLRNSKRIKHHWQVQFAEKNLTEVVSITYNEYNPEGDIVKSVIKKFGDSYNITFNDYPSFDLAMVSSNYISQLERSGTYFSKVTSTTQYSEDGNLLVKKFNSTEIKENKSSTSMYFEWRNKTNNLLVKDSVSYSGSPDLNYNYKSQYYTYEDGQLKSLKSNFYKGNKLVTWETLEYNYLNPQHASIIRQLLGTDGKAYTFKGEEKKSNLGDRIEFWYKGMGKSVTDWSESHGYMYDSYGNIRYKFYKAYTPIQYFYNFYEYQDGFVTGMDDYSKRQALVANLAKPKLSLTELVNIYRKASEEYNNYKYESAYILYKQGAEAESANPEFFNMMAYCYFKANGAKKIDKALSLLDKTMEIDPYYFVAYKSKADLYYESGNNEKAMEFYKLAADWGVSYAVVYLKNRFNLRYKPDSKLFATTNELPDVTIAPGVYRRITGDCNGYVKISVENGKMILYGLNAPTSETHTYSEVYKQSKKNPAVFIHSKNEESRMICNNNQLRLYTENKYCSFILYQN